MWGCGLLKSTGKRCCLFHFCFSFRVTYFVVIVFYYSCRLSFFFAVAFTCLYAHGDDRHRVFVCVSVELQYVHCTGVVYAGLQRGHCCCVLFHLYGRDRSDRLYLYG